MAQKEKHTNPPKNIKKMSHFIQKQQSNQGIVSFQG